MVLLIVVGLVVGLFSGLFGIGGGLIIVPALVLLIGMDHRQAAATSIAAILPTSVVGAASYAVVGNVQWIAAAALAGGIILGAYLGSHLLARLPVPLIQWIFMGFLAAAIVALWLVVPQRDNEVDMTWLNIVLLVLTGIATGVIGGIVGIGGGIIVIPILIFFFGASDLVAKGTSLLMMVPGSISGTFGNYRRGNVDLRKALILGLSAATMAPFGSVLAALLDPFTANVLFSIFLVFILLQMLLRRLRAGRAGK